MSDSMLYIVTTKYPKADPITGQPLPAKFRGKTRYSIRSVEYEDGGEKVHFESDSKSDAMRYLEKNQADWARKTAATRTLTASDRRRLIRLASSMTAGSPERRAVLAGLERQSSTRPVVEIAPGQEYDDILSSLALDGEAGVDFEVTIVLAGRELAKVLGVQERVLVRRLDQREKKRDHLISERDLDAIFNMKRNSIHNGAMKDVSDLIDHRLDFDLDLDGPQDNPYLSVKRVKPDAVQVTFEVGSIVTA